MKSATRSPAIKRAVESARKAGYTVRFVDYCEDSRSPGFLGQIAGICDYERKEIRIRVKGVGVTRASIAAVIEHEVEHALGAEVGTDRPEFGLRCGNRHDRR